MRSHINKSIIIAIKLITGNKIGREKELCCSAKRRKFPDFIHIFYENKRPPTKDISRQTNNQQLS